MRGCGHIQDLSVCWCSASEMCGLSYAEFSRHTYLYLRKENEKKKVQRGLLSGSLAEYGPAGGDSLLLPPTVPLKSKGSWE